MFKREKSTSGLVVQPNHRQTKKDLNLRGRHYPAVARPPNSRGRVAAESPIGDGDFPRSRTLLVVFPTLAGRPGP